VLARPSGPLALRFYLQPAMAAILAIVDGLHDARDGRSAWLWSALTDAGHRRERLADAWRSIGKVFVLACVLDLVYQVVVLHALRPLEALVVATLLALVPYAVLRGPVNRLSRRGRRRRGPPAPVA
jgi:hypothetical protein